MNTSPQELGSQIGMENSGNFGFEGNETEHLPEHQLLPIDSGNIVEVTENLAEKAAELSPEDEAIIDEILAEVTEGPVLDQGKTRSTLDGIRARARNLNPLRREGSRRVANILTLLLTLNLIIAACMSAPPEVTASPDNTQPTVEVVTEAIETPVVQETAVDFQTVVRDFGRYAGSEEEALAASAGSWEEIVAYFVEQGLALPGNLRVIDISATNVITEVIPQGVPGDWEEGTSFTLSNVEGHENEVLTVTLDGANAALAPSGIVAEELAIGIEGNPAVLDGNGKVVAYVDRQTGQWTVGEIELAPEVVNGVPQSTATATAPLETEVPQEVFAEPTRDNVEFDQRWTVNQFPLPGDLREGQMAYQLNCITDEIVSGRNVEIMSPSGEGSGIYLLASAECWYREPGGEHGVLVPVAITDRDQMVIADHAIQDYEERYETEGEQYDEWNTVEEYWTGWLDDFSSFDGKGWIFPVSLRTPFPGETGNSYQGLGREALGAIYTQEVIDQFASGDGDPSMLPYAIIGDVKYYVLPPFNIGLNNTLNN